MLISGQPSYYSYKGEPAELPQENRLIEFTWKSPGDPIQGWYLGLNESEVDQTRWMVDVGDPTGPHYMAPWAIAGWKYVGKCADCEGFCPVDDYLCEDCRDA